MQIQFFRQIDRFAMEKFPRDFLLIAKINCNFPRDVAMNFRCTIAESLGKKVIANFNFTEFFPNRQKLVKNTDIIYIQQSYLLQNKFI